MKITGESINYNHNLQSGKCGEKTKNYSEFTETEENSGKDLRTSDKENCPVHDIYESMNVGGKIQLVTTVGVYNMGYHASLYLSDAGNLTCLDEKGQGKVLWEIPLNEEDYPRIEDLMRKGLDFVLREKNIVEQYLKGTINTDDMKKIQDSVKDRSAWDDFWENCCKDVKKAWESIQGTNRISRINDNSDEKICFLTEIDKYMLQHLLGKVKTDGSLESTIHIMEDITDSLKNSMEQYSSEMQERKRMELDVYESFKEELERLKQVSAQTA